MSGLNLGASGFGGAYASASVPVASNMPTGTTISQAAYGIQSGSGSGPGTAGFGTVGLGVAGALVLAWLWYTLPR